MAAPLNGLPEIAPKGGNMKEAANALASSLPRLAESAPPSIPSPPHLSDHGETIFNHPSVNRAEAAPLGGAQVSDQAAAALSYVTKTPVGPGKNGRTRPGYHSRSTHAAVVNKRRSQTRNTPS